MENNKQTQNVPNPISFTIKLFCWFFLIFGAIMGFVYINQILIVWSIFGGAALGGFALAEIIQLLQDIKDRLEPNKQNNNQKYQKEDKIEKQNNKHKYTSDEIDNFLRD